MHLRFLSVAYGLLIFLAMPLIAQERKGKPKPAPNKELTREEIAKLGGFEPAPDEPIIPAIIQVQLLIVSVPKADALAVAEEMKSPNTAQNAYRGVLEMIKKKKAKLVGSTMVETKPGQRCVTESIAEVRYGAEFEKVSGGKPAIADKPDEVKAPPAQAPAAIGVVPISFETRNTGITFETEPILGPDNKTIDLNFAAQHVQVMGWDTYSVEEKGEVVQRVPQPRFSTNKVTTNVTVWVGTPVLGGLFASSAVPESMDLFLLRVSTRDKKKK